MDTNNLSMADAAYVVLQGKKRPILFNALWEEVRKKTKSPKENISNFYEDLILDPRFVCLKDNKWDLKERRSYADSHVDVKNITLDESLLEENGNSNTKKSGDDDDDDSSKKNDDDDDSTVKKSSDDDYD